jgi:hypothetical protein
MEKHDKTAAEAWEICHEALRLRLEGYFRFKKGAGVRISSKTPEVQATIERIAKREATS